VIVPQFTKAFSFDRNFEHAGFERVP